MARTFSLIVGGTALLLAHTGFASAAEIKVFSTIGVQSALEELAPKFEKASGHKLNITGQLRPFWSNVCRAVKALILWCLPNRASMR